MRKKVTWLCITAAMLAFVACSADPGTPDGARPDVGEDASAIESVIAGGVGGAGDGSANVGGSADAGGSANVGGSLDAGNSPAGGDNEAESQAGGADGTIASKIKLERSGDGVRLALPISNELYVMQTFVSPPIAEERYVVHIVRKTDFARHTERHAVVVRPGAAELRAFPMYAATVNDVYNPDSVAEAFGFRDDRRLVYVAAVDDAERKDGYRYRVEQLDIVTGETVVLAPDVPDAPTDDHFAPGWLSDDGDRLMLNSYNGGMLWEIDLKNGETTIAEERFRHAWPFHLTQRSPDGERFWYTDYAENEYRLHDRTGERLATVPFGDGYDQYPPFQWSPHGRYAVLQDTRDRADEHIINENGEVYLVAPQRLRFYDRDGERIHTEETRDGSGRYVEVVGWIAGADDVEDGAALLREYELDRAAAPEAAKVNARYRLLDVAGGTSRSLETASDVALLTDPAPAPGSLRGLGADPTIAWVDADDARVVVAANRGRWLSATSEGPSEWLAYDDDNGEMHYYFYDPTAGRPFEQNLGAGANDAWVVDDEWIVTDDLRYIRIDR